MSRQASSTSSGQAKSPSLTRDVLMLGDVYLTLAWLAFQRLRHGPLWPWEAELGEPTTPVVTLLRPQAEAEERAESAAPERG